MKLRYTIAFSILIFAFCCRTYAGIFSSANWNIAAKPRIITELSSEYAFTLNADTKIYIENSSDYAHAEVLRQSVLKLFGFGLQSSSENTANCVALMRDTAANTRNGQYTLIIGPSQKIIVSGHDSRAVLDGVASLVRILSDPRLYMRDLMVSIPPLNITDWPSNSGIRGINLQMSFTSDIDPNSVKCLIDSALQLHYNALVFEIGHNWNSNTTGAHGTYSRQTLRDLVGYAKARGFEVIPGINLLGHLERAPYWKSTLSNGIRMTDSSNYTLLGQMLDEIAYDFNNPKYFHGGMDEALQTLTGNAIVSGKTEKQTLVDHIVRVNNLVKARGMQLMIWHDMLVSADEAAEVANGSAAPNGTAAARPLIPDDVIINVWDYSNGGGRKCVQLFKAETNPVINSGWMYASTYDTASVAQDENIMGVIGTTWADITVSSTPSESTVLWYNEHLMRIFALTAHYNWYAPVEAGVVTALPFDPAIVSLVTRWDRRERNCEPFDYWTLTKSGAASSVNCDAYRMIQAITNKIPVVNGFYYLKGMPAKFDSSRFAEAQSCFSGSFAIADNQNSASYYFHVKIKRGTATIREFNANGVNRGRGSNELIIYTNTNLRTGTNSWGCEVVVVDGKVFSTQLYDSADSRVPRNGFVMSAHGSRTSELCDLVPADIVEVTRVYSGRTEAAFVTNNRTPQAFTATSFQVDRMHVDKLVFLHATAFAAMPGDLIGYYRISYSDGTYIDVPVNFARNIGAFNETMGFYDRQVTSQMWLAYSNYGSTNAESTVVENVYAYEWINPDPGKPITQISMLPDSAAFKAGWATLAVLEGTSFCNSSLSADLNHDCTVDFLDLIIFSSVWLN